MYAKLINKYVDGIIFITENEFATAKCGGVDVDHIIHSIIYNPVDDALFNCPRPMRADPKMHLIFIGTLDDNKAPDRLVEIARLLQLRRIPAVIHAYGGSPRYKKWIIFERHVLEKLRSKVINEGLQDYLIFYGHTNDPEQKLLEADLSIRPSRINDPWGRDVIEAMALGTPILTHGKYGNFVRDNDTGRLLKEWDPALYVDTIERLTYDRETLNRWSSSARRLAMQLFSAKEHAENVMELYGKVLHGNLTKPLLSSGRMRGSV